MRLDESLDALPWQVVSGRWHPDDRAAAAFTLRATALLLDVAVWMRGEDAGHARYLAAEIAALVRTAPARQVDRRLVDHLTTLERQIADTLRRPPPAEGDWKQVRLSSRCRGTPTTTEAETLQLYAWLASRMAGRGDVVEVGCWLGGATCALVQGVRSGTGGVRVHAYDSFRWQAWMDRFLPPGVEAPAAHTSFLDRFSESTAWAADVVVPHRLWIDDDGRVEQAAGSAEAPIELYVYDMGADPQVLESTWRLFAPRFLPGTTIVVFNEYGKLASGPIWELCRREGRRLRALHKPGSSAKAFLYLDDQEA